MSYLVYMVSLGMMTASALVTYNLANILQWGWIGGLIAGFCVCCINCHRLGLQRNPLALVGLFLLAGLVAAFFYILDQTRATYFTGVLFLLALTLLSLAAKPQTKFPASLLIFACIAVSLTFLRFPINRIVVSVPNLAVPTYFALLSSPDDVALPKSSFYQDIHSFHPLAIALETRTGIDSSQTMPRLQLAVMRDSNIAISDLRYQTQLGFFFMTVAGWSTSELHSLTLDKVSDEVSLSTNDGGILVDQIAYGEHAWVDLTSLDINQVPTSNWFTVTLAKLLLWLFVFLAYLCWRPARTSHPA